MPVAALALAGRRERAARGVLGLPAPPRARRLPLLLAVAAVPALLGLAATQPVLSSASAVEVRTDAEVFFVIDNSRSMLAARTRAGPTRVARARQDAIRLRDELADIPAGVATMTDHVLPALLPNPDPSVFEQTVRHAVLVNEPPPGSTGVTATSLGALGALGTQNFFSPPARRRLAIVLTDGESRPFDTEQTVRALAAGPGVKTIFIHVWSSREAVYDADGRPEQAYHVDLGSGQAIAGLAQAAGGASFDEGELGKVARVARADLGSGPTKREGGAVSTRALSPYLALASLVPLLLVLGGGRIARLAAALRRPGKGPAASLEGAPQEVGS